MIFFALIKLDNTNKTKKQKIKKIIDSSLI